MIHRYDWRVASWWQALRLAALVALALFTAASPVRAAPTHIAARLIAEGPAAPGAKVTLAIAMKPEAGWHGYWSNPGDAGFGMTLRWSLPPGATAGEPRYPVPGTLLIAGLMNHVYKRDYAVLIPLTLPADAPPGARLPISVHAEWLACTDQVCVPERAQLTTEIAVAAPGAATPPDPAFERWRARLPAPLGSPASFQVDGKVIRLGIPLPRRLSLVAPHVFAAQDGAVAYAAPQEFRRRGDMLIVTIARPDAAAAAPARFAGLLRLNEVGDGVEFSAAAGQVPTGGTRIASGASSGPAGQNLAWLILGALAGGLLLNVMPCVFPILSLKALSLARAGESAGQARREGVAYTAGTVLACAGLGGLLLILRAAGTEIGWAFQLQEPGVVAALLLLAAAITANLAGLFEFAVPGFASDHGGANRNAFATGLLAAFVATPCTGPFMAAAMGAALLLPPLQAMALFIALGLGLALPFLALAVIPALRRALPRPGRWMNGFRRAMAVPMGLTALALAWLAWRLAGPAFAGLAVLLAAALIAVLAGTGRRQRRGLPARGLALGGTAALAALAVLALPPLTRAPVAAGQGVLPSRPFTQAALDRALADGRPVFVYLTADWCLTCKINEQVAIEQPATRDAFKRAGILVLRGDWSRRDPAITRLLTQQGAAGVPLYLFYPRGARTPQQLPQLLTPGSLLDLGT